MNKVAERQVNAWLDAANDLGIRVAAPYWLDIERGATRSL
jgi:hypothetical protein